MIINVVFAPFNFRLTLTADLQLSDLVRFVPGADVANIVIY